MPSQRQGQSKILVSCSFCQSTNTQNLVRTIYGLLFVLRFVTTSKRCNLWTDIRSKVVELLDRRNIQHSSINLVRFSWVEDNKGIEENEGDGGDKENRDENEDVEENEDFEDFKGFDFKIPLYGTVVTTPITIWVGVLPNTLTSEVALHSSNDILDLLKEHGISDI
jgi:hypothetical protein